MQLLPIQFLFLSASPVIAIRFVFKSGGKGYPPHVPLRATSLLLMEVVSNTTKIPQFTSISLTSSVANLKPELTGHGWMQTDYKLKGLESEAMPPHLALTVRGALYPQPEGRRSLRGHVEMSVGFNLPPVLALVPPGIIRGVGDTVLRQLGEQMKHDFDKGLAADFKKYTREKLTDKRTRH